MTDHAPSLGATQADAVERRQGESFDTPGVRHALLIGLVSFVVLVIEIASTRLLSYRFFYHFVFLVVSLAQLGLAAAGAWLFALDVRRVTPRLVQRCMLALPALVILLLLAYTQLAPAPNLSIAKVSGVAAIPFLTLLSLLMVSIYLVAGLILAGLFTHHRQSFRTLYAADLAGAGMGCVTAVGLLWATGPILTLLLTALLVGLGMVVLLKGMPGERERHVGAFVVAVTCLILLLRPSLIEPRAHPSSNHSWDHLARTDRLGPSNYIIDGDAGTFVTDTGSGMAPARVEFSLVAHQPEVAVIGAGAGPQVIESVLHNAKAILAIDINPTIIRWNRTIDARSNAGVFLRPEVTTVVDEGRHALRATDRRFDLILMHAIDTYSATSAGAYSLSENHLYTVEAMLDFLARLKPKGVMAVRRWLFYPPRENLRLFTTIYSALEQRGIDDPRRHIIALAPVRDYRMPQLKVWGLVLFSASPFTTEQLSRTDEWVSGRGWSYLYRPDSHLDTPFHDFVAARDRDAFYDAYVYDVRPCRDTNPFFFQLVGPWRALSGTGGDTGIYSESMTTLTWSLGLLLLLCMALLLFPIARRRHLRLKERPSFAQTSYFSSIGAGFMFIEIAAIQAMTLFLGHPVYALSVVLLGVLLCAGLGSLLVERVAPRQARWFCVWIGVLGLACAAGLFPLIHALIAAPMAVRVCVTLGCISVLCVPMGIPMAAGIRLVRHEHRSQVAWAWAANGTAAVLSANLCMFTMIRYGTPAAFVLGAGCYGIASVAKGFMIREASPIVATTGPARSQPLAQR